MSTLFPTSLRRCPTGGAVIHTSFLASVVLLLTSLGFAQAPDFTVTTLPATLSIAQDSKASSIVLTNIVSGFSSAIELVPARTPAGITVSFSRSSIPSPGIGTAAMTISVSGRTPTGTYPVTFTATTGARGQQATVLVTVTPAQLAPTGYGWHQLANTVMESVCLGNVPNGMYSDPTMTTTTNYDFNCYQTVPWSGAVADDNHQRLIVWGGGHSDYAGNEVSALNLNGTPSWTSITSPTIPVPYVWDGNAWEGLNPYFIRSVDGGVYQPGASPSSRHTYNNLQYVPYQNKLYSFGGAVSNIGYLSQEAWTLDLSAVTWNLLQPYSQSPGFPTTAYNPNTGHIIMHDKSWTLSDFNPSTGTYSILTQQYHIEDGTTAAIDPVNNLFVVVGAAGTTNNTGYPSVPTSQTLQVFSLNPPYTMTSWANPTCDLTYRSGGLAWDGNLGLMVGYPGGGNQVYLLNTNPQPVVTPFGTIPPQQCLDVPISTNPSPVQGVDYPQPPEGLSQGKNYGIYGRFQYFPSLDTFALVNDRTMNAWTMQLTGGGTTPNFAITESPGTVTIPEGGQGSTQITTTVSGGFNNPIALTAVGVPANTTVTFSPATIAAPGAGTSTMTINVGATTPAGSYPITVNAYGGGDTRNPVVMLNVTAAGQPSFTLTAVPTALNIQQGNQSTVTLSTTVSGGFNNSISFSVTGVPTGTTASFNPQSIPAPGTGSTTMTVNVGANTPVGNYTMTVTGNGGGVQQNVAITLTVSAAQGANFTLSASPASLSIQQGNQGSSTITSAITGGFNGAISLSASGMPSGTTVSFNPATIPAPGSGNSTMTITVGASTPAGNYPITVTGNGGGVQQNTTVTLTVTAQQQPNFSLSASPASLSVQQGNHGSSTITSTVSGGFDAAISLSATGMPSGVTVGFNPQTIPAPGSGNSAMTITVAASTPVGNYPIIVAGNGGGVQQNTTVTLTVTSSGGGGGWRQGFDFRNTLSFVTDPPGDLGVLPTNLYPTQGNGVTYGWVNTSVIYGRDRIATQDPRLAGINYAMNGAPATFKVELPSAGAYNLSLALGDAGYQSCWVQCQIQFFDGTTLLATVTKGSDSQNYFDDARANNWSAVAWPSSNLQQQVTLAGTLLTVVVGTTQNTGDDTPLAFLGVAQVSSAPNFALSASPASLSVQQGNQGSSTITSTISGGFNGAISLSASGMPSGTTVSFNPATIAAPGSGTSAMTITVGASTPVGTYPITVTGSGGGLQRSTTVTLTVTLAQQQPNFALSASPASLSIAQGNYANSTITSTISGGFNAAIGLSASGMPSGTTVSFNPETIPAPGSGTSVLTITVGASTPTGTYPITVSGSGGGLQRNTTVTLTVTAAGNGWQHGFDFRNTASFVSDPAGDVGVLPTTAYPTNNNGLTYGWVNTHLVNGRDRIATQDPRLAGVNFAYNGTPATFNVGLPSAGTYTLSLAMGDAGYEACWVDCQIQFKDGSTVLATIAKGLTEQNFFDDAEGNNWSAANWPSDNLTQQVTLSGTVLTVVVGTTHVTGDDTPIAFLGVAQVGSGSPNFSVSASPASLSIQQGNQGSSTITSAISGGFNGAISLSASGMPSGATVSFNPSIIPAPGSGTSSMTLTVGSSTPVGTYPITITGNGGGLQRTTTVTLTVTAAANFALSATPSSLTVQQGNQGSSTISSTISGGFNSAISLSASGVPAGTTVSFSPQTIPAPGSGSSSMTLSVGASTAAGTYPITITGNGGGLQRTATVTLTVTSDPSFTLSAAPSSLTVQQGNQGSSTITSTLVGGFNGAISLSASGVPSGTTVTFNPQTIPAPGSGNSAMTISVGGSTPTGNYTITVTGTSGSTQESTTVTLTITGSGGGGGGDSITVYSTSGSGQTNRVISIGRFFQDGEIPNFAQAVIAGNPILTQCDVKNRWPDGSLKFAIVSFIIPSLSTSGTQVSFQNQGSGNNTGYLQQSDMLGQAYNFDGQMQLTGTGANATISARSILDAGDFRYWLQGPIVTAVILEDRTNRTFDVNTDGGVGNPLHPIYEAWFYPQGNQVELGFTIENSWASSTAANSARNQTFALTLTTGFNNPTTQLTQTTFTQDIFTRWRRSFWVSPTPAPIQINYNWPYLASTTAYANFNPAFTANEQDLEAMYAVYTNEPSGRLTIPGIDNISGNGGIVNYDEAINAAGYAPWIGPYAQWDVDYLMTGDSRMQKMMADNADLAGRFPIFFREADHYAGTGHYFDEPGTGSVDPYGHVVSINARQYETLNLANSWNQACNNNGADLIATSLPGDGSNWYSVPSDTSHLPDFAYVPYTLTGKYFYLENEMLEAGFAAGHGQGCYSATQGWGREGHYGMLYSQTREMAWALRTMAYAAFIAVDGTPEGAYFASKVINNVSMAEGATNLAQTTTGSDAIWSYNWGLNYFQYGQSANPSSLHFWRMGDCQDGTTTCYVANGDGANNNVNANIVQSAMPGFMSSFMDIVFGLTRQLGIVDTTPLLQHNARRYFNILLNPAVNHFLIEQYVYPTTLVGYVCQNPANPGCVWITDWNTFQSGYLTLPTQWSMSGVDYAAEAASAISFMTNLTVDGYSGQNAWNYLTTSDAAGLSLVYNDEPQWTIQPLQ